MWVEAYNTDRPHQGLDERVPVTRRSGSRPSTRPSVTWLMCGSPPASASVTGEGRRRRRGPATAKPAARWSGGRCAGSGANQFAFNGSGSGRAAPVSGCGSGSIAICALRGGLRCSDTSKDKANTPASHPERRCRQLVRGLISPPRQFQRRNGEKSAHRAPLTRSRNGVDERSGGPLSRRRADRVRRHPRRRE